MFDKEKYSQGLVQTLRGLADTVDRIGAEDYSRTCSELSPGQQVPPMDGSIRTDEGRKRAVAATIDAHDRIEMARASAHDEVMREMAQPPSAEASAYIATLSARDHLKPRDIEAGVRAYGDNYAASRALADLNRRMVDAGDGRAYVPTHPLEDALEYVDAEADEAQRLRWMAVAPGGASTDTHGMLTQLSFSVYASQAFN